MKSVIFLAALFFVAATEDIKRSLVKVQVIESIEKFRQANPSVNVTELVLNRNARLNQNWYTLGRRQSNDRLVSIDSGWAQYPSKQNVELTIWYPINGVGAYITYVQVLINQDNGTFGRGYIVSGGIGQRNIQIVVEAWNTAYVRYDYQIYGV